MTSLSRLGLGTAQFGSAYGVSNRCGKPDEAEIGEILAYALDLGIRYLDTAAAYGDAEALVGRNLPARHDLRIVTKIEAIAEAKINAGHRPFLVQAIERSLERLQVERVHAVIVHNPHDLRKPGFEHVVDALQEAQSRGLTVRTGASVYDATDLELVTRHWWPEIIQLPLNVLDRRLLDNGWVGRLAERGTEVHVRSTFLQGLLLMRPSELPEFFSPLGQQIFDLHAQWAKLSLSPVAACLAFVLQNADIDAAIVGINRRGELEEIANALSNAEKLWDPGPSPAVDPIYLDPRRWPSVTH